MPSSRFCVGLALLASCANGLRVASPMRPFHHGATSAQPRTAVSSVRMEETTESAADATTSSSGGVETADAGQAGIERGAFMAWYTREKAIEKYKEENPIVFTPQALWSRFDGLFKTAAVLTVGWYIIPVVTGIRIGLENGDVLGEVIKQVFK